MAAFIITIEFGGKVYLIEFLTDTLTFFKKVMHMKF